MKSNLLPIIAACALVGCATQGRKIDNEAVAKIKVGNSKQEVRALMGSPEDVSRDIAGNETWTYNYVRAQVKGETFIPFYGSFAGGTRVQKQQAVVSFGPDGKVTDLKNSFGGDEINMGASAGGKARLPEVEQDKRKK